MRPVFIPKAAPGVRYTGTQGRTLAKDNFDTIRRAVRSAPEGIDLRIYDNWLPLLAIADTAGGNWPLWVRIAARCFAAKNVELPSIKVELSKDIREAIGDQDSIIERRLK